MSCAHVWGATQTTSWREVPDFQQTDGASTVPQPGMVPATAKNGLPDCGRTTNNGDLQMLSYVVAIATRSSDTVASLQSVKDASVSIEKNLTGETIVVMSIVVPVAIAAIKEIGNIIRDRGATIRSQEVKIGKGTMSFKGLSEDAICQIIEKLRDLDQK